MIMSRRRPIKATEAMEAPMMAMTFGGSGHTGRQSSESFTDIQNTIERILTDRVAWICQVTTDWFRVFGHILNVSVCSVLPLLFWITAE